MTHDMTDARDAFMKMTKEELIEKLIAVQECSAEGAIDEKNLYLAVARQYWHFHVHSTSNPVHLSAREKRFRFRCMREELEEYEEAETLEDELDALVDLVVFALGTAYVHGFHRFNTAVARVIDANKKKVVGPTIKRGGKYGDLDLQKPPGWQPADLSDLVAAKGDAK